ncbi:MAG: hypothetical protein NTV39_02650 [Candidatus Saccharibacteria bacterium]|nr:hypothetical protein [Candidatus Saccharibacteria bacterium]
MKISAIYTTVHLVKKPAWLDKFRNQYDLEYNKDTCRLEDEPYDMHITLTQPRFVGDEYAIQLKKVLGNYFKNNKIGKIKLEFAGMYLDRQDEIDNGCIMVNASKIDELLKLQLKMRDFVKNNNDFCDIKHKAYEDNFIPHLTIGRDLSKLRFDKALQDLPQGIRIEAEVSEIILAIVRDESSAERKNPKNLTVFKL